MSKAFIGVHELGGSPETIPVNELVPGLSGADYALMEEFAAMAPDCSPHLQDALDMVYWHPAQAKAILADITNPNTPFDPTLIASVDFATTIKASHIIYRITTNPKQGIFPSPTDNALSLLHRDYNYRSRLHAWYERPGDRDAFIGVQTSLLVGIAQISAGTFVPSMRPRS